MSPPSSTAPARPVLAAPDLGGRTQVYLHAGQIAVASEPAAITTILGSCVAVCLRDPDSRVGGMNHFLLPHHVERERSPRFGSCAIPALIDAVVRAAGACSGPWARGATWAMRTCSSHCACSRRSASRCSIGTVSYTHLTLPTKA